VRSWLSARRPTSRFRLVVREAKLPRTRRATRPNRGLGGQGQAARAADAGQMNADQRPEIPDAFKARPRALRPLLLRPHLPHSARARARWGRRFTCEGPKRIRAGHFRRVRPGGPERRGLRGVGAGRPFGKLACEIAATPLSTRWSRRARPSPGRRSGFWAAFPAAIKKWQSAWFWITVHTLGEASQPGKYRGKVTITAGRKAGSCPSRSKSCQSHSSRWMRRD